MTRHNRTLLTGMSLAVTWMSGNAWRRPDSEVERLYDPLYYTGLAQLAESACMDFVFRPDSLFIDPSALASSVGFSGLDPTLLLTAVAMGTSKIGLLTTASTTFHSPYVIARQLQSLHHISGGRAGWNVVTALDGHENFGLPAMPGTESRYERADEFVSAVQQLWHSFPPRALLHDKEAGRYAEPSQIKAINFEGKQLACKGPLTLSGHSAGDVPLFQAGASETGKNFAAKIARGVFAATPDMNSAKALRADLRQRAEEAGRQADDIRILPGLSLFLAGSYEEALKLFRETRDNTLTHRHHQLVASSLGLEVGELLSMTVLDESVLQPVRQVRSKTHSELIRNVVKNGPVTLEALMARPEVAGSGHWIIIGTAEQAADEIETWFNSGAIDGFIALPGGSRECFERVCSELMPALQKKGLVKKQYHGSTFESHLT